MGYDQLLIGLKTDDISSDVSHGLFRFECFVQVRIFLALGTV